MERPLVCALRSSFNTQRSIRGRNYQLDNSLIQAIQTGSAFASLTFRRRFTPGIELLLRFRLPMPQIPYCAHRIIDDAIHHIRNRNVADVITLVKYLQGVLPPRDRSLNAVRHEMPFIKPTKTLSASQ